MIDLAYAMAPPGEGGGDMNTIMSLLPIFLIFGIFYLFLIRPQQKKAKEHKQMLENIKKGDSVMTQGGIFGKVTAVDGNVLTVEIADKIRVRVSRGHIAGLGGPGAEQNP